MYKKTPPPSHGARAKHLILSVVKRVASIMPDKACLTLLYFATFKKRLHWKNPITFNEKLQWLKLYNHNPQYSLLVDKYAVKQYVAKIIGENHVIPTLGVWSSPLEIDFDNLPNKFVLKTTHDSGNVFLCTDKKNFDIEGVRMKLGASLKHDFSHTFREKPYKNVPRKIIAEKYIEVGADEDLVDYKFFCFNGKPKFLKVDFNRRSNHRANYYTLSWELLPFGETVCPPDPNHRIQRPKNFDRMIVLAERLAANIPFVRVDLYNVNGEIYFGEMTFFPAAGFGYFCPDTADMEIGHLLQLPVKGQN